jgi:DNA (cytosine-5)-methyltransferase 1
MNRPVIADLFCKAGGAAMGYYMAGFDVIGFDIEPQPNYPFKFYQWDCTNLNPSWLAKHFDAVHASPPCQHYSSLRNQNGHKSYPDLVAPTRTILERSGLPYIIENVVGAPLINPVTMCGSSFGLPLRRHRLFESNSIIEAPRCDHSWQDDHKVFPLRTAKSDGGLRWIGHVPVYGNNQLRSDQLGERKDTELCAIAMGIYWMTRHEMTQAIPPAYTLHLGRQLIGDRS